MLHKRCDHTAQSEQTFVYLSCFTSSTLQSAHGGSQRHHQQSVTTTSSVSSHPSVIGEDQQAAPGGNLQTELCCEHIITGHAAAFYSEICGGLTSRAPERDMFSEPARSTRFSFPTLISSSPMVVISFMWMVIVKIEWERLHEHNRHNCANSDEMVGESRNCTDHVPLRR